MDNPTIFTYIGARCTTTPIVFLPGWGFSGDIARLIPLPRGTVIPQGTLDPGNAVTALRAFLHRDGIKKIHIHGWSMGANLAIDFAAGFPHLTASITLLSLRRSWPEAEINAFTAGYRETPEATFKKFCRRTFAGNAEFLSCFETDLIPRSMSARRKKNLIAGLAYLCNHEPEKIAAGLATRTLPVTQIHGRKDLVAPVAEMAEIAGAETIIIPRCGHAPFLFPEYRNLPEIRKKLLTQRFSRAAATYDAHAHIQKKCRQDLAAFFPEKAGEILELGCGTGGLSRRLRAKYPAAGITLVELSREMLKEAEKKLGAARTRTVCADAETFIRGCEEKFDLIVSGAAMHWFSGLDQMMAHCRRLLAPGGSFIASLFGPGSLGNLGKALAHSGGAAVAAADFPTRERLKALLETNFIHTRIEEKTINRRYHSTLDLLRQLQKTGTSGTASARLTPGMIRKMDRWFEKNTGEVRDEYQIFFLSGKRGNP